MRNRQVGTDIYGVKNGWKLEQRLGDTAETGFRHDDYYHKYFHGYTELRIEKPNGKYKIERYYTDNWYRQDCSDKKWILQKILQLGLTLISAFGYFWLMSRPDLEGNTTHLVAIPGFVSVVLLILLVASSIAYAATKRKMTWWEHYASTTRMERYTLLTGGMIVLTGVVDVLQLFSGVRHLGAEIGLAAGILLVGCIPFLMYYLEKKMHYITEKNDVELPPGEKHLIS